MSSSEDESFNENIPTDAIEIEVTSIINPYYIRVRNKPIDKKKKEDICKKLSSLIQPIIKRGLSKPYKPAVGDDVIVSNQYMPEEKIDLPDWTCRGVVMDTTPLSSDVFFLDDGITLNMPTESLIQYSRSSVPFEPLTYTIGVHNILPTNDSDIFTIVKEWPKSTTDTVKKLIEYSSKIYFKSVTHDQKKNKYYGDLFLILENKNFSLSKILLQSDMAILLSDDILKCIRENLSETTIVPLKSEKVATNKCKKNSSFQSISNQSLQVTHSSPLKNNQAKQKILVSSKYPCKPLDHIADSRFTRAVHKALENQGVRLLKQIQSYMWPAIKQGFNVVTVSSKSSGKTTGYLVPIISSISDNEDIILRRQKNEKLTKPVAVILCTSLSKSIEVASMCNHLLHYHKNIKVFTASYLLNETGIMAEIYGKFTIMVTTVPFLLRTLEAYPKLNVSELSYLVFDGADVLFDKYMDQIITLIKKHKMINKEPYQNIQEDFMQIIAVSETWTNKINDFAQHLMRGPYICIGEFVEAAAFCNVQGRMLIRHSEKKKHEVFEALGDYSQIKTMVICLDKEEAIELNDFLKSKSVDTLLAYEEMVITELHEMRDEWNKYLPGMYPVIICTDPVLSELEISDVQFLIHYSITNTSKTKFNKRFSALMDNWLSDVKPLNSCKVLILFDETKKSSHFKGVVNILKRLKVELPDDWDKIAEGLDIADDLSKKNFPLCESIKLFGSCESYSCPWRHRLLDEVDTPTMDISINDELKLMITVVHNASKFSARVFESKKPGDTQSKTFSYNIVKLRMKMKKYYSDEKNKRTLDDITVGKMCAMRTPENEYLRVQILNIIERDFRTDKPKYVTVINVDSGEIYGKKPAFELWEITKELAEFEKTPIVDVYLLGLCPPDEESSWSSQANAEAHAWVKENSNNQSDNLAAYAKVLFHIGNSIWTDSLVFRSKLIGYSDLAFSSINNVLKSKKFAVENESHQTALSTLCKQKGLFQVQNDSAKQEES